TETNAMERAACKRQTFCAANATDVAAQDFNTFDDMDMRGTIGREGATTQQTISPTASISGVILNIC
ncbi:hypothetical protein, partial [Xanthomonas fragariae]|uniref:hypothetical protein n=1 Tax=Xanthomonas fragariae TaxID=48664 RepID=UPI001F36AAC4